MIAQLRALKAERGWRIGLSVSGAQQADVIRVLPAASAEDEPPPSRTNVVSARDSGEAMKGVAPPPDLLSLYIRTAWCVQQLAQCVMGTHIAPWQGLVLWPCLVAAVCHPTLLVVFAATACGNLVRLARMPVMWDAEMWSLQIDSTLLLACACAWLSGGGRRDLSLDERNAMFRQFALVARVQLSVFYFAAAFWKLNTSFLNPRTSCAPIFFSQLLAAYLPFLDAYPSFIRAVGVSAPMQTILVELAIPSLFAAGGRARQVGLAIALAFHGLIAITPPLNNASGFSLTAAKYLFVVLEEESGKAASELCSMRFWASPRGILGGSALATVLAVAVRLGSHEHHRDYFLPAYALVACVLVRALVLASVSTEPLPVRTAGWQTGRWRACAALMQAIAVLYAFGGPVTGLMDQMSANMYSNLSIHAESNHLLAPTGVALGSALLPGGIVRVVATDSPMLLARYPAEITERLSPRAREYLRAVGHSQRQFNPMKVRILGPAAAAPDHNRAAQLRGAPLVVPYTLPAIELRRLLIEAREAGHSFRIAYQHLPGLHGDETWRQTAGSGTTVRFAEDPRTGSSACSVVSALGGPYLPCAADELVYLPAPSNWLLKLVMLQPYPIILGERWTELHCFGP